MYPSADDILHRLGQSSIGVVSENQSYTNNNNRRRRRRQTTKTNPQNRKFNQTDLASFLSEKKNSQQPQITMIKSSTNTTNCSTTSTRTTRQRCASTFLFVTASTCLCLLALLISGPLTSFTEAASANRVDMGPISRHSNQFFLNEFCDLESKTLRSAKKLKHNNGDTHSVFLQAKNTQSSVRVLTQKQQLPSSISFGFGSSQPLVATPPLMKPLNCSIIVVAPKSHGLLVTVNSFGLPKNLTKLGIVLNHNSSHAQHIHLDGHDTSAQYLLTQPQSSKIAINLQSFQKIDWSHVSFDILFTVYKKSNNTGCPNKWFDCGDNICVPKSLVCDRNRNCPNGNDELVFYRCYTPLFWSLAAFALILLCLIVFVVIFVRTRRSTRLNKMNSFSNNQLSVDSDLIMHHEGSKLDLTQADLAAVAAAAGIRYNQLLNVSGNTLNNGMSNPGNGNASYLASNLYLGGFENPVWNANGTLTKQQKPTTSGAAGQS